MIALDYILLAITAFAVWRWITWKNRVKGRQDAFNAIVQELATEIVRNKQREFEGKWPEIIN